MDFVRRSQVVRRNKYCFNCLARTHDDRACASRDSCRKCGLAHHTLLHPNQRSRRHQPTRPVRERIGQSHTTARQSNNQIKSRPPRRKKAKPAASTAQPNQQLLSEAIRSLAAVLCVTSTTS